jgi:hypothetical protein
MKKLKYRLNLILRKKIASLMGQISQDATTIHMLKIKEKYDSMIWVRDNIEDTLVFSTREGIQKYAVIQASRIEGSILEFGVFEGGSINRFQANLEELGVEKEIIGFDSFEGLGDSWTDVDSFNAFDKRGIIPPGIHHEVKIIKGYVDETLPIFLHNNVTPFALIHFDMDLYKPTKFVLESISNYLNPGTLILFDELHGYVGWRQGELKALQETLEPSCYKFKAFGPIQALIEIV